MPEARSSPECALACQGVTKVYGSSSRDERDVKAVDDVSMEVAPARITALVGPSGSGKSTLLRILGGIDLPDRGRVLLGEHVISDLSRRRRRRFLRSTISYMFQVPTHNLLSYLTVGEHIELAAQLRSANDTSPGELLEIVGLSERIDHLPRQLSGGEQQRLAVASSVVGSVTLVLADEPTAELDQQSGTKVLSHMHRLSRVKGISFVVASHDPAVRDMADEVLELSHGKVVGETR